MKFNQRGFAAIQLFLIVVIVAAIAGVGWFVWQSKNNTSKTLANTSQGAGTVVKNPKISITNFDECSKAGNPIQTSYPEVCVTKDGKRFTNTTTSDPYAGWKTYTTKYDKMSFKYPNDMTLSDTSHASVAGQDNVTPGTDTIKLVSSNGFTISMQLGLDGIGGGCPECQSKYSDPVTIAAKPYYMNYIDSGQGSISNIAVAADKASFIGNIGTHVITISGTTNKAGAIVSGSFRDASDTIVGKPLDTYKTDHFVSEFKLLLQSISY